MPKDVCLSQLGYSYEQRISDYKKSFDYALKFRDSFDSITIIETVSKIKVQELEENGIDVYYSNFDNSFKNKGLNEMFHIQDFIKNSTISNEDLIIKITGRYLIENVDILNINLDFVAKYDGDIYPGNKGVHTFFFGFKKVIFNEFIEYLNIGDQNTYDEVCVEWLLKYFLLEKNITILSNSYVLGVTTCLYNKANCKWTKKMT